MSKLPVKVDNCDYNNSFLWIAKICENIYVANESHISESQDNTILFNSSTTKTIYLYLLTHNQTDQVFLVILNP